MSNVIHYNRHNRPKYAGQEPYSGYVQNAKGEYKTDKDGKKIPLDPGLTKQEMTAETDVNRIMAKYEPGLATRMLQSSVVGGAYGDFTDVKTFQQALEIVQNAEEAFESLPALLRARFENDPVNMVAFCTDPRNAEELVKLGLAVRKDPPATPPAPPAEKSAGEANNPPAGKPAAGGKP